MVEPARKDPTPDLTTALRDLGAGRSEAAATLLPAILAELRAVARSYLGAQPASHTLQPTALVNEVFLKLFGTEALEKVQDRAHFFALAAKAMRQILVDHARQRQAAKRSGAAAKEEVTLEALGLDVEIGDDLLDVDSALHELARLDERQAHVVELRFFAGLEMEQIARALEVSITTVEREWRAARAWLGARIRELEAR